MSPPPASRQRSRLSVPVQVRLAPDTYYRYAEEAQQQGLGVSTYLRYRLEAGDQIQLILETLREVEGRLATLESSESSHQRSQASSSGPSAVEIETLLLLRDSIRSSGRQQTIDMYHAEMRRQGIPPWQITSQK